MCSCLHKREQESISPRERKRKTEERASSLKAPSVPHLENESESESESENDSNDNDDDDDDDNDNDNPTTPTPTHATHATHATHSAPSTPHFSGGGVGSAAEVTLPDDEECALKHLSKKKTTPARDRLKCVINLCDLSRIVLGTNSEFLNTNKKSSSDGRLNESANNALARFRRKSTGKGKYSPLAGRSTNGLLNLQKSIKSISPRLASRRSSAPHPHPEREREREREREHERENEREREQIISREKVFVVRGAKLFFFPFFGSLTRRTSGSALEEGEDESQPPSTRALLPNNQLGVPREQRLDSFEFHEQAPKDEEGGAAGEAGAAAVDCIRSTSFSTMRTTLRRGS